VLFNAGCNEQVCSPKPRKKFSADLSFHFREKRKKRAFLFRKMTSASRRLGDSNNQLKSC